MSAIDAISSAATAISSTQTADAYETAVVAKVNELASSEGQQEADLINSAAPQTPAPPLESPVPGPGAAGSTISIYA
jgi:hypothetical protein